MATTLDAVRSILNAATGDGNPQHGGLGRFWNLPRDQFVNAVVYGEQVIVVGKPDDSALIKALKGVAPFDGSVFPRMPIGRTPVSDANIAFIAKWIQDGASDKSATPGLRATHQMQNIHIPDWNEIKTYFTNDDIQHMLAVTGGSLNLADCASVLQNAAVIYQQVSTGQMPPGNPWGPDKINGFFSWWKSNPKCPS